MEISVIICTYNRSRLLGKSLESLEKLNVSRNIEWELIIVDNNSKDSTNELLASFAERKKLPLRYVYEPHQGLSHARNRGVNESFGEVIAFIDDDVVLPIDWLNQVHRAFSLYDADVISGRVILSFEDNAPSWLDDELRHCFGAFDLGDQVTVFTKKSQGMAGIGALLCFRRKVFQEIGMFDIAAGRQGEKLLMGEETELINRVLKNGGKCVYFPEMYLYHIAGIEKLSKKYVLQWHFRFGQWEAQCNKYENLTIWQSLQLMFWSLKRLVYALLNYISSLSRLDTSFKNKVDIVRYAGFVSNILKIG